MRAFASDIPDSRRIWRFSNDFGAPGQKRIEKVAVRLHLYAPIDPITRKRDDTFERKLSHLEQSFSSVVWHELCHDMVDLSWQPLRKLVSLLVTVMQFRNPTNFEFYKEVHTFIVKLLSECDEFPWAYEHKDRVYPLDPDSWPAYRDATEDELKRNWIKSINTPPGMLRN